MHWYSNSIEAKVAFGWASNLLLLLQAKSPTKEPKSYKCLHSKAAFGIVEIKSTSTPCFLWLLGVKITHLPLLMKKMVRFFLLIPPLPCPDPPSRQARGSA